MPDVHAMIEAVNTSVKFNYSNHNVRGQSRWIQAFGLLWPGLRRVQAQVRPYAEAWMTANEQALRQTGPLWVVLGDSMSQGVGAATYDQGWVGQLKQVLAEEGKHYRVLNLSISGARIEDVLRYQLPALRRLGLQPDLVTVLIGGNDMIRRKYREHLVEHFGRLLEELPSGSYVAQISGGSMLARRANALLDQAALQRNFKIISMNEAFRPPFRDLLAADHFHPNERGYKQIADVFKAVIARYDKIIEESERREI